MLKSVYIYESYRKIKTGLSLFWTTLYVVAFGFDHTHRCSRRRESGLEGLAPLTFDVGS